MKWGSCVLVCLVWSAATALPFAAQDEKPPSGRRVAVTIDDLPLARGDLAAMQRVTTALLAALETAGVPAVGFVNESKLYAPGQVDARIGCLAQWVEAGLELGNHTFSHRDINDIGLAAFTEDVLRGETVTRMLLERKGRALRYFRHPFLHSGATDETKKGLDTFLAAHGYTVAPVTLDNADYVFAVVYADAKARGDGALTARVVEAYVAYMASIVAFYEALSRETLGYEVRQTLLLHANELNADHFGELAAMMKGRGYAFITLEEALGDPAYALPEVPFKGGVSWLHRWRKAKRLPSRDEPSEPKFIADLYAAILKAESAAP